MRFLSYQTGNHGPNENPINLRGKIVAIIETIHDIPFSKNIMLIHLLT